MKPKIENKEKPYEIVKMSELPPTRQKTTRIIILDKKIRRKIKPREELSVEEPTNEK